MRKNPLYLLALIGTATVFLPMPAAADPGVPAPKVLVIDRNAILSDSKVGADILRQLKADRAAGENELNARAASLREKIKAFQQKAAILSASVKAQKTQELQTEQDTLQKLAEKKDALLQGGLFKARAEVGAVLSPILKQIMVARGANLILDKAVVIDSSIDIDITQEAVKRLDQKMSTLKVDLVPPPAGATAQQH
jgi:Skp family chaperone for outer membrane proteins